VIYSLLDITTDEFSDQHQQSNLELLRRVDASGEELEPRTKALETQMEGRVVSLEGRVKLFDDRLHFLDSCIRDSHCRIDNVDCRIGILDGYADRSSKRISDIESRTAEDSEGSEKRFDQLEAKYEKLETHCYKSLEQAKGDLADLEALVRLPKSLRTKLHR